VRQAIEDLVDWQLWMALALRRPGIAFEYRAEVISIYRRQDGATVVKIVACDRSNFQDVRNLVAFEHQQTVPVQVTATLVSRAMGPLMIRIERGAEVGPGIWEYRAPTYPSVFGKSRQPLLDACRQLESILGDTSVAVGVFRDGSDVPDLSCALRTGARTMVSESDRDGVRFVKFREFALKEAA
jgi:hypothetical protein